MKAIGKDGFPMVLILPGEFEMGTDSSKIPELVEVARIYHFANHSWFEDEIPCHKVYLDAFYMDVYPVTNAQYRRFVRETGYREPIDRSGFKPWVHRYFNADNQPVVCVTWDDAKAYCEWSGERLPTEAEWEKAARGGLMAKNYPRGDDVPEYGIYGGHYLNPTPVDSLVTNGYGLYGMAGNVWEWCADWYDEDYYAKSPKRNPTGPVSGRYHVVRGGSWSDTPYRIRVANRYRIGASAITLINVGFRCAKNVIS
jgi:iron(II)-dependent oxidoreductase